MECVEQEQELPPQGGQPMGSRKRSAQKRQIAEFKAGLEHSLFEADGLFAREDARRQEAACQRDAALRDTACESKNRYATRDEALMVADECGQRGVRGLHAYKCSYCNGWHLTSKPPRKED